ncbi:MAG TPA: PQQ-binding-like beta-propeller repeat protein [Terracidiphilus sp.]|nr:PQQ-binding-like beta-propeller repeat protein [Terracidiphilus sp.]
MIRWKTKLPDVRHAILPSHTTRPNPVVVGSRVFASLFSPGAVVACSKHSGKVIWKIDLDSYAGSSVTIAGNKLFATSVRTLYALNPTDGAVCWSFTPYGKPGEWIYSLPAVSLNRVFIGDRKGYFHCLDSKTGERIWSRKLSRGSNNQVNATALIAGNRVITANNDGRVVCYSIKKGETLWRQRIDGACISEILRLGASVIVASHALCALDLPTGRVCWKLKFPDKLVNSATLSGLLVIAALGTDFHSRPDAWEQPSAFQSELTFIDRGIEIKRKKMGDSFQLRTDSNRALLYAVGVTAMKSIRISDGVILNTRQGQIGLPDTSGGYMYVLAGNGTLFAEAKKPMQAR